jgi:hypothetical protein
MGWKESGFGRVSSSITFTNLQDDFAVFPNYLDLSKQETVSIVAGRSCEVEIMVYTVSGVPVKIWSKRTYNKGETIPWDGTNDDGKQLASGVYIIVIKGDDIDVKLKLILKK